MTSSAGHSPETRRTRPGRRAGTARPALYACLLLLACGGDSPTDPGDEEELGHPPAAMVGVWTFQSATVDGAPATLSEALEWDASAAAARLHIEANGTYYYEEIDAAEAQLWAEGGWIFVDSEGGTIEANVQWDSDGAASNVLNIQYTLSGGVLALEWLEGGSLLAFTLTSV